MVKKSLKSRQRSRNTQAYTWRCLNVVDAQRLRQRWQNRENDGRDPLNDSNRFSFHQSPPYFTWKIQEEYELERLLGALQYSNPHCSLWFRGEPNEYGECVPRRMRKNKNYGNQWSGFTKRGLDWLISISANNRLFRDPPRIGLLAILQHYGLPTSFLDVTRDYRVATFFALHKLVPSKDPFSPPNPKNGKEPTLLVFATPRTSGAVTDFHQAGVSVVDLSALIPSLCLRPHVQRAGFIGLSHAVKRDLAGDGAASKNDGNLDDLCIARLKLKFKFDWNERYKGNIKEFFLPAAQYCGYENCSKREEQEKKGDDWRFDLVLHALNCIKMNCIKKDSPRCPEQLPDFYWELKDP